MLAAKDKRLDDLVVEFLGTTPHSSADQLHAAAEKAGANCSLRAVYKALARLETAEVIVHRRARYALRTQWLLDLRAFSDRAWSRCSRSALGTGDLPAPGSRTHWHFSDLGDLNNFNAEALLSLLDRAKAKTMYDWIPHPWFCLVRPREEKRYLQALSELKASVFRIIGGRSFLDRLPAADWRRCGDCVSWEHSALHGEMHRYYVVVDDFVLTTSFDPNTERRIDRLFAETASLTARALAELQRFVQERVHARVVLEHSSKKAARLRGVFERHFSRA